MKIAVRQKLGVELYKLAGGNRLFAESLGLLLTAVDPYDPVGLSHVSHFLYPVKNMNVFCHSILSPLPVELEIMAEIRDIQMHIHFFSPL